MMTLVETIERLQEKQKQFQKFVGAEIDSNIEEERLKLIEIYIYKLIEEGIELRKEFPSMLNIWSKQQKYYEMPKVKGEMCDILLFFINICCALDISFEDMIHHCIQIQANNFAVLKRKKMKILNDEILRIPALTCGIGQGNLEPEYVIIGQNPGQTIESGYEFWKNENDGSSQILLPAIKNLNLEGKCYFTNVVKSTTQENQQPTGVMVEFWHPFLAKELEILAAGLSEKFTIIAMGKWTSDVLKERFPNYAIKSIKHPAYFMRSSNEALSEFQKEFETIVINDK